MMMTMMKAKTKNCVIKVAQVNDTHTRADTHTHTHTHTCVQCPDI